MDTSVELQRKSKKIVVDQVIMCVSILIHGISDSPDFQDAVQELYGYDEEREVLEFWAVSEWLADKLIEKGEQVGKGFLGMHVWGRRCSGQAIYLDEVIQDIAIK